MGGERDLKYHMRRGTLADIGGDVGEETTEVGGLQLRNSTNLGESVGNGVETGDVFAYLPHIRVGGVFLLEDLYPCHDAGDRGAQLMGGLLGESHP